MLGAVDNLSLGGGRTGVCRAADAPVATVTIVGSSILTGQSARSLGCGPLFAGAVESYPVGRVLSIAESAAGFA